MLNKIQFFLAGSALLLLAGCHQTSNTNIEDGIGYAGCCPKVTQNTTLVPAAPYNAIGQGKTVVIMPFADYSGSNYETAIRRNIGASEAVMDKLAYNGFDFPVQADVFRYLQQEGVLVADQSNSYMESEMASGEWSSEMQEYINERVLNVSEPTETVGLSNEEIKKIGKKFHADYVLRGSILEFKKRQDSSWQPERRGILPTLLEGTSRILVGFADVDSYDGKSKFDFGDRSSAMIGLRLWVQDANTGEVVWTNHSNVEAYRGSVFADPQYDTLFMEGLKRSACLLVHDFSRSLLQQ